MKSTNKRRKLRLKRNVKLILIGILVLSILGLIMMMTSLNNESDQNDDLSNDVQQNINSEQNTEQWIEFPYLVDDGNLEIVSLFQFTGFNPDDENKEEKDIASIQFVNHSDEYLEKAEITIVMDDDSQFQFVISDVPAHKSVMAFSTDSVKLAQGASCVKVDVHTLYNSEASCLQEDLKVSVDGIQIFLTNTSDKNLTNVQVICHSILDQDYFGGMSYTYQIESIPANESAVIEAWDCFLGESEVVRITSD